MIGERNINLLTLSLFVLIPVWAYLADEPFTITLMTRAVIFALAAVGLNLILGIGGFEALAMQHSLVLVATLWEY